MVLFNLWGLLFTVALGAVVTGVIEGAVLAGWIARGSEAAWFVSIWAQCAAVAALLWDRSDEHGFWRSYGAHFVEAIFGLPFIPRHSMPVWLAPNPRRRALFFAVPLALFPFVCLLSTLVMAVTEVIADGGLFPERHPDLTLALALLLVGCAFTAFFARATARRRAIPRHPCGFDRWRSASTTTPAELITSDPLAAQARDLLPTLALAGGARPRLKIRCSVWGCRYCDQVVLIPDRRVDAAAFAWGARELAARGWSMREGWPLCPQHADAQSTLDQNFR